MLISPLMGPIVGAGFSLGIYDFNLLKKSLKNLLIATLAGLSVSTIYFYLSPFKEVQSELLARTSPNIYDVLIAFFGGLVGVIAITRLEKGNPIPGVAIATALMPPLCTAGYGLATANFKFFFGALFLYAINCVFICIATFSIVKYLKYPAKQDVDGKHLLLVRVGVTAIIFLMLLPSGYFAYSLYNQQKIKQGIELFIEKEFFEKGNTIIYKKTIFSANGSSLELAFLNKSFSKKEILLLNERLKTYCLSNTKLSIKQNLTDNINALRHDMLNEVTKKDVVLNEKEQRIAELENEIAKNKWNDKQLFEEIKVIFPTINSISISDHKDIQSDTVFKKTVFLYKAIPILKSSEELKLKNWLQKRLSLNNLEVIHQ